MSDKYCYAMTKSGDDWYIYRMDQNGTILRANIHDSVYKYVDLAEIPERIAIEFNTAATRKWTNFLPQEEKSKVPAWAMKENDSDEGITDEEFMTKFLNSYPWCRYNDTEARYEMEIEDYDRSKRWIPVPFIMLKSFARRNKYFGTAFGVL